MSINHISAFYLTQAQASKLDETHLPSLGRFYALLGQTQVEITPHLYVTPLSFQTFVDDNNLYSKIRTILLAPQKDTGFVYAAELNQRRHQQISRLITRSEFPKSLSHQMLGVLSKTFKSHPVYITLQTNPQSQPARFSFNNPTFAGNATILDEIRHMWADFLVAELKLSNNHQLASPRQNPWIILHEVKACDLWGYAYTNTKTSKGMYLVEIFPHTKQAQRVLLTPDGDVEFQDNSKLQLTKTQNKSLIKLVKTVHQQCFFHQQISWTMRRNQVVLHYAVHDSRHNFIEPKEKPVNKAASSRQVKKIMLTGTPASPGIRKGLVRIVTNHRHLQQVRSGEVLVTNLRLYELWSVLPKVSGIITDAGGTASHLVIYAHEIRKPVVVNVKHATSQLKNGMAVTLDGETGKIYSLG